MPSSPAAVDTTNPTSNPPSAVSPHFPTPSTVVLASAVVQSQVQQQLTDSSETTWIAAGNTTNRLHIASTIAAPSHHIFSAASLPRTSSLLPPPHIVPASIPPHTNVLATSVVTRVQLIDPNDSPIRPFTSHSRSSSISGLTDGFRNLNRWSASTSSSKTSAPYPSRRLSIDAHIQSSTAASPQQPRRLQKSRRPSISSEPLRAASSPDTEPPQKAVPLLGLPPIVPLPSLELEVRRETALAPSRFETAHSDQLRPAFDQSDDLYHVRSVESSVDGPAIPALAAMAYERNGEAFQAKGHSRNGSQATKGSVDTTSSPKGKDRSNKPPSQKAMLSRALQKANTAVQLDNAQNLAGARQSYAEACELLQQVLNRTSGEEDKRKLEAIRRTYTSRIEELDQMAPVTVNGKALPARPGVDASRLDLVPRGDAGDREEPLKSETTAMTKTAKNEGRSPVQTQGRLKQPDGSAWPGPSPDGPRFEQFTLQSSFSRSPARDFINDGLASQRPADEQYIPPLSRNRVASPARSREKGISETDFYNKSHSRTSSHESVSWLDPIDESGGSGASSVHSRSSSVGIRRKHIRAASGDTEAEFDAALDAAVEAAYDEGFEPMEPDELAPLEDGDDVVANAMRRVELAKERVRQTEREAIELEQERERRRQLQQEYTVDEEPGDFYDGDSSDEEERIFEEMSRGYSIDEFALATQSQTMMARESDSSGLTTRTWQSSVGSNPLTSSTALSTVNEVATARHLSKTSASVAPPPDQSLPGLPLNIGSLTSQSAISYKDSVRDRRLSGQNPKQLKIETTRLAQDRQALQVAAPPVPSPTLEDSSVEDSPLTPPLVLSTTHDSVDVGAAKPESPSSSFPIMRKNYSSSSLRSMRSRNMSTSNLDDASDMSPGTPLSNQFGGGARLPAIGVLPTPIAASFRETLSNGSAGGLYLFDDNVHSPYSPGSPNPLAIDGPVPLEPCPMDFMLRPFWLMRCLYQTVVHPRGGYLSNKLFIPRDVWKVKGVKLRNVEDKVASCDFLTAALLNLAQVDTCDADAVLEEMQSLEGVLEQVQANLSRKLGTEVGVQSSGIVFKDTPGLQEADPAASVPRSTSVSGKPSSFSWRRLRTKNSAAGLGIAYSGKGSADASKDSLSLQTLPMTSHPTSRPSKRIVSQAQFTGPNANYMGSLARLFDAAQTIDQIARQVEDPGLRHADKTQVGLELCTRHAAEFFGFFICRFVLADLSILLDKFIKRGSEWVLA